MDENAICHMKKTKNVDGGTKTHRFEGDAWIYAGIKRDTKFIAGFAVEKEIRIHVTLF
ncbi:MAG: hypothetical protein ACT6FE_00080 [Methanosarcinaceae archaeon]